jgi:hypothetical protein
MKAGETKSQQNTMKYEGTLCPWEPFLKNWADSM